MTRDPSNLDVHWLVSGIAFVVLTHVAFLVERRFSTPENTNKTICISPHWQNKKLCMRSRDVLRSAHGPNWIMHPRKKVHPRYMLTISKRTINVPNSASSRHTTRGTAEKVLFLHSKNKTSTFSATFFRCRRVFEVLVCVSGIRIRWWLWIWFWFSSVGSSPVRVRVVRYETVPLFWDSNP